MIRTRLTLLTFLVCSIASASNGPLQIGIGTKSKAMGGAGIALPLDSYVIAHNPAGMAVQCSRVDLGFTFQNQQSHYNLVQDISSEAVVFHGRSGDNFYWPELGALWKFSKCQTAGIALYTLGEWKVAYNNDNVLFGSTTTSSRYQVYYLSPAWAWQVTKCHSIGVAANLAYGRIRFGGLQTLANRSSEPDQVTNLGFDSNFGASVRFGWLVTFNPCIAAGLTYQTPTWFGKFSKYGGFIPGHGEADLPSQLGGGITYRFHPLVTASVDVIKVFWRDSKLWLNGGASPGDLGLSDGPGLGWNDQTLFKLGLSWDIRPNFILRLGYNHGATPIPTCDTFFNILNAQTIKDHITTGATLVCGCHEVNFAYVHGFAHSLSGMTIANPLFSEAFGKLRGRQNLISVSWGMHF